MDPNKPLTMAEYCRFNKISRNTALARIRAGKIDAVKNGAGEWEIHDWEPDIADHKKAKYNYEAKLRELQYEKESGLLVPAEEVRDQLNRVMTPIVQAFERFPSDVLEALRLGPEKFAIVQRVTDQIRMQMVAAIERMSDDFSRDS